MKISNEFFDFCLAMHQDFEIYGPEPQDWIYGALGSVRKDHLAVFRDYLNELLSGKISDAELQETYRNAPAEIGFLDNGELRQFLEMARDTIDENLRPGAPDRIELARQALLQRLRDAD